MSHFEGPQLVRLAALHPLPGVDTGPQGGTVLRESPAKLLFALIGGSAGPSGRTGMHFAFCHEAEKGEAPVDDCLPDRLFFRNCTAQAAGR